MKPHKIFDRSVEIDGATRNQFYDALKLDSSIKGALMPDAHLGYSLPIGGVIATSNVIFPAWVGYDIGCGVSALKVEGITREYVEKNKTQLLTQIYQKIPTGFQRRNKPSKHANYRPSEITTSDDLRRIWNEKSAVLQLGTLGGGNHFIELCYDDNNDVWICIHSGSRGFGHAVASFYMKKVKSDSNSVDREGIRLDTEMGQAYYHDMTFCQDYALENRRIMTLEAIELFSEPAVFLINRHHNHAEVKDGIVIHRKGATHAEKDMLGIIPGNMLHGSYIVRGRGNEESICSSSHGAGRAMSRSQAKKDIPLDYFQTQMKEAGVACHANSSTLDEAPDAYKNPDAVMESQIELVDIVNRLYPMVCVKAGKSDDGD